MACPRFDFHMHTTYLGCANETMTVPAIVAECERVGVRSLGITDHLNTLDRLECHVPIRKDIEALNPGVDVYFGVELNFTGPDEGFAYSAEIKESHGFQFAIGGIHGTYLKEYDQQKMVDIQHRHHLKTCEDPLVDVLVHPYWFGRGEFEKNGWPWFDSVTVVPESYTRELGQAAKETGTAVEINACANLVNGSSTERYVQEYTEYLAILASEGVVFSVGSDAHDIGSLQAITKAWEVVDALGLPDERVWKPPCEPMRP